MLSLAGAVASPHVLELLHEFSPPMDVRLTKYIFPSKREAPRVRVHANGDGVLYERSQSSIRDAAPGWLVADVTIVVAIGVVVHNATPLPFLLWLGSPPRN